ncbi:reverse transcriptase domain-containing protein [Tanacetum coccineum]
MMDSRRRSNTLRNEEICRGLANAHSTDARRGSDNVPHSFDREHKRSFICKKGRRTGEHDIVFQKRGDDNKETPKYYLIELPLKDNRKEAEGKMDMKSEKTRLSCEWKLYTDGAVSSNGSGARLMLIDPEGKEYTYALRFEFKTTNNEAEYEALLAGLRIAQEMEIYLVSGLLPEDPKESKKVRVKALQYKLIRGSLYQRATLNGGWNYKVRILLAVNAQRCHKGPLPTALGGLKFLAIAIEHSTKWVEAKPLTTISGRHVERFVWKYVVCRFGVSRTISSKDEKHFREGIFADLCKGLKVKQSVSPVTEHMEIMNHIEKKLTRSQQGWVDDLAQAIIPIAENAVAKDDKGRTKEVTKKKEGKEVASIEEAYYQNKLRRKPAETLLAVVTNTSSSNFITSSSNDLEYFLQSSPAVETITSSSNLHK